MGHFLQSDDWARFQTSLGRRVERFSGPAWSALAILEEGRLGTRLYVPYGPTVTSAAALTDAVAALKSAGHRMGCAFLRLEPVGPVATIDIEKLGGLAVDYVHLQPERTQIVELAGGEEDVIAGMKQSNRSIVRNFAKKGIEVTTSHDPADVEILLGFLHEVADRNAVTLQSDDYLRAQARALMPTGAATLYVARLDGEPIAASLCYDGDDTRVYAHAGAATAHRKLSAPTILIGRMMIDAQAAGKRYFDLYGIGPDGVDDHPWSGFTKFKQSFGGQPVDYLGAWDVPVRPWAYRAYRLALAAAERAKPVVAKLRRR